MFQLTNCKKLTQLTEDLQRAYSVKNSQKNAIYDPKKGLSLVTLK